MVRIFAGVAAAVVLAGCATTPPTPQQQIVGSWMCKTSSDGAVVDGAVNYRAGGTGTAKVTVAMADVGMQMTADAESSWSIRADGKMEETITKATATSGKMGGQDVPLPMLQEILNEMVGEASVSTFEVTANTLVLVEEDEGVTTSCTR
jgi:hypothetical protein